MSDTAELIVVENLGPMAISRAEYDERTIIWERTCNLSATCDGAGYDCLGCAEWEPIPDPEEPLPY